MFLMLLSCVVLPLIFGYRRVYLTQLEKFASIYGDAFMDLSRNAIGASSVAVHHETWSSPRRAAWPE